MKAQIACLSLCLSLTGMLASTAAQAAPPAFLTVDHSSETLMDKATAKKLWESHLSLKIARLYPPRKWGYLSEVEGGFTESKLCVVTARAMLMPPITGASRYRPPRAWTAFTVSNGRAVSKSQITAPFSESNARR